MSIRTSSVVVYGPAACGKNANAWRIAGCFRLRHIIDDGGPDPKVPPFDHLVLCETAPSRAMPSGVLVVPYEKALKAAFSLSFTELERELAALLQLPDRTQRARLTLVAGKFPQIEVEHLVPRTAADGKDAMPEVRAERYTISMGKRYDIED